MKKLTFLAITLLLSLVAKGQIVIPEGVTPEEYTLEITHAMPSEGGNVPQSKKITALVAFNGSDVYLQGLAFYFPNAYVKGVLADGVITVPTNQLLGEDMYGAEYLIGYVLNEQQQMVLKDILFNYDATTQTITYDPSVNVAEIGEPDPSSGAVSTYAFLTSAVYTPGGVPPLVPVVVPEGLKTESYLLSATKSSQDADYGTITEPYEVPVLVGFYGDDLYIQGIIENVPTSWAKATKNAAGKYIIPKGQYIGSWSYYGITYDYFLAALSRTGSLADVSLAYNASTNTFSTTQTIAATDGADSGNAWFTLNNTKIIKIEEREATPSTPEMALYKEVSPYGSTVWYSAEIFVPLSDTDGKPMLADKLSYVFYADKGEGDPITITFPKSKYYMLTQDMTELPYNFTDGLEISRHTVYFEKLGEAELNTWKRMGIQSIYRGNDVEHRSEILWVDTPWTTGIQTIRTGNANRSGKIYNLNGQEMQSLKRGLNIVNGKKVFVK